jgi:DNA-binding transcriptional LysR family regulator
MREELSGVSALVAVAEKRKFASAAAELGVTVSAVSQAVAALERRVGVRLVQRTTRSVGLTEAGERFVARVKPALSEVRAAFEGLNDFRARPAGTLRLNVPHIGWSLVLEPLLAEFMATYPEIHLDVTIDDGLSDIVDQGFDAGIRLGEMVQKDMVAVRVSPDQRCAVVGSAEYFRTHGKPKHPRELLKHQCIGYRKATRKDYYRWEFTENGKDFEIAVNGSLTVNDADAMKSAAVAGVGLAYLLEATVQKELAKKRLIRVLEDFCPPFDGLFLYYPSRANSAPKLRALVEFLRKHTPSARRKAG